MILSNLRFSNHQKPHLYISNGVWYCVGQHYFAPASTFERAYRAWYLLICRVADRKTQC